MIITGIPEEIVSDGLRISLRTQTQLTIMITMARAPVAMVQAMIAVMKVLILMNRRVLRIIGLRLEDRHLRGLLRLEGQHLRGLHHPAVRRSAGVRHRVLRDHLLQPVRRHVLPGRLIQMLRRDVVPGILQRGLRPRATGNGRRNSASTC